MLGNLALIQQSYSVAFADYVRQCEAAGRKILKLQTGDPDFVTHPAVTNAAEEALSKGLTNYCDSRGLPQLRNAVAEKLRHKNNITADPDSEILITHGAVHAISIAIRSLLNPGEECIIIEPYWRSYEANVLLSGGIPVYVRTSEADGFQLNAEEVISRITEKTKLIIINSPNNPSGAVYKEGELRKLAIAAAERQVMILSDEVYEEIIFDDKKHFSIASEKVLFSNVISVYSFSKTFAMTGWRIGYVVASKKIIAQLLKLSQFSITSLSPFNQIAAVQALTNPEVAEYVKKMRGEYEERRLLISKLIAGTWLEHSLTLPEGTFYSLINTDKYSLTSLELAKMILEVSDVAFTPGIAFGNTMDKYIRLCFSSDQKSIETAIRALIQFDQQHKLTQNKQVSI
jgi:aspartate/methionine/tyrosine aminotransferase